MKIGILTQPLHINYGGLVQAWALQKTLAEKGHEVIIINRVATLSQRPLWRRFAGKIKRELLILLRKQKRYIPVTQELKSYSEASIIPFKETRYLGISPDLKSNEELIDYVRKQKFDAYVVGSDQVWRPKYSPNLMTYFLDFVKDDHDVKKIAYAASFGVDNWEFSNEESKTAKTLAPLFDIITVREYSGIELVKKHLSCKAEHVLDPTMLLNKEEYIKLIENSTSELHKSEGELFCYVLDNSSPINELIDNCRTTTGLIPYYCNCKTPYFQLTSNNNLSDCIVPPIEQWLKSFLDATMIVTDSFHGVVFSIIFNKPFWVVSNENRGAARFTSLLSQFGLNQRLVENPDYINWNDEIDWIKVNTILKTLSQLSKQSLFEYL